MLGNCGISMSPARVRRVVQAYERQAGRHITDLGSFVASRVTRTEVDRKHVADGLARVVSYADPTGEGAVRNVMRGVRAG